MAVGPEEPPSDPEDVLPPEEPPSEEFDSEEPFLLGAEAPPFGDLEDFAGGSFVSVWTGSLPVAVGGASEYWIPLESA